MSEVSGAYTPDMVNHPPHYNTGKIEVIDYILDKFEDDYLLGNVCKYISRARHKGNTLQDLEKAQWYLAKAIEEHKRLMSEEVPSKPRTIFTDPITMPRPMPHLFGGSTPCK